MRDLHQALKHEPITKGRALTVGVDFTLVRSRWGKEEFGFGLHAAPNQFTLSGIQTTDFLALLGFQRSACAFIGGGQCYARLVNEGFALDQFVGKFDEAFAAFKQADRDIEDCGIFLSQLEGWGFFYGKQARGRQRRSFYEFGDGHTMSKSEGMKKSEDRAFQYRLVWVVTASGTKGWITHYRPRNPPLSVELESVFNFLGLKTFQQCPEFDFEPCSWSGFRFEQRGDSFFDSNAETAHRWFDSHPQKFASGVENLLRAHSLLEGFGMRLLPIAGANIRLQEEFVRHTAKPAKPAKQPTSPDDFDVAISFAGPERPYAEELADRLQIAGFSVFYDGFYPEDLWGKDLIELFHEIYSKRARYCVIFVSDEYNNRAWTIHERRSAQERMLRAKGQEYILPIKTDAVDLPGLPTTLGHVSLKELGIEGIAALLIKKLRK
jgi:TIR domain